MTIEETRAAVLDAKIRRTMLALEKNNITCIYAQTKKRTVSAALELISKGDTISCGGSMTLEEGGIFSEMQSGNYNFLDRSQKGLSKEEVEEIYRKTFFADAYFTSANAVTEKGEIYNVDGNGNRVSAIAFGPKKVIIVVGANKIVKDLEEAQERVKTTAAPCNAMRLHTDTPCEKQGMCVAVGKGMTDGCLAARRMCCQYLITGYQKEKGRIFVIITPETLGY